MTDVVVVDVGVSVLCFVVGLVMTFVAGFWLIGPIGRTVLWGKLLHKMVVTIPRMDRLFDMKLCRKGVKGRVTISDYGIYKLDPEKTYITTDGVRIAEFPDGMATNSTPEDAELATRHANGEKNPTTKIRGKNYSYHDLINSLRETLGPDQLADLMFRTKGAWSPVPSGKGKINLKAIVIVAIVVGVIGVGILLAKSQGWIG